MVETKGEGGSAGGNGEGVSRRKSRRGARFQRGRLMGMRCEGWYRDNRDAVHREGGIVVNIQRHANEVVKKTDR